MKCTCNSITPVTVVEDLKEIFENTNHDIFNSDSVNNIKNFEWHKVALFYMMIGFTAIYLGIGIWGYFRD